MRIQFIFLSILLCFSASAQHKPNVILIYADDLGYGDLSCYGAEKIKTPNIDKLASTGLRLTNGHSTSATCTPSRYALMTGIYPWRRKGTSILPGDAALIVPTDRTTLPKVFKQAGYKTAVIGKWHLGLGETLEKDWNKEIRPGPNETGFDYSFIFPATADRVPTVFMQDHYVVALDQSDPIAVDYKKKIGNDPTGESHPELLKMKSSPGQGHNNTIVNGIGRIGYMRGGHLARWVDEEISYTFLDQASHFIEANKKDPFFLFFATTEPHVPRMPATVFKGKSGLGPRGDAILQLDWTVGEIMKRLEAAGIADHTLVIFTSDNGPVLDDGYQDNAVALLQGHRPWGGLRGGKYSTFEAGTRMPFIINWPKKIKPGVSDALVSQIDFFRSFSTMLSGRISDMDASDSENMLNAFLGKDKRGRASLVVQGGALALLHGDWKYISPSEGAAYSKLVGIETGNLRRAQLYNLRDDIAEQHNLADQYPERVKEMEALLEKIKLENTHNAQLR